MQQDIRLLNLGMEEVKNGASAPEYSFDGIDDNADKDHVVRKAGMQPDLEVQVKPTHEQRAPPEQAASNVRVAVFLATYFVMNISLTLYNKTVLGSVSLKAKLLYSSDTDQILAVCLSMDLDSNTYWPCSCGKLCNASTWIL